MSVSDLDIDIVGFGGRHCLVVWEACDDFFDSGAEMGGRILSSTEYGCIDARHLTCIVGRSCQDTRWGRWYAAAGILSKGGGSAGRMVMTGNYHAVENIYITMIPAMSPTRQYIHLFYI